jgi:hypothetical protein
MVRNLPWKEKRFVWNRWFAPMNPDGLRNNKKALKGPVIQK